MLEAQQDRRKESWLQVVWAVVMICNATGRLKYPLRVERIMRRLGFLSEGPEPEDPDVGKSNSDRLASLAQDIEAGRWRGRGLARRKAGEPK